MEKKKNNKKKTTKASNKKNLHTDSKTKTNKKSHSNNKVLYYLFFGLLLIVIILGINVYIVTKDKSNKKADIIIPIIEKNTSKELSLDMEELTKSNKYSIKIANYRGDNINKETIDYTITIENESKAKIEVTKDSDDKNLMTDQISTRIENVSLKKDVKDASIYYFSVIDKNKVKKGEKINLKIDSLK